MTAPLDQHPHTDLNINSALRRLAAQFEHAELPDCNAEARDLVMAATGLTRIDLITQDTKLMSPAAYERLQDYSTRRLSGEPMDNILGWREFYGRRFAVSPDVLSPRQETEEVVAKALQMIEGVSQPHILDLGTGSGAIITTVLSEREDAAGMGVDISEAALTIVKTNAAAHGVLDHLSLLQSDWFEAVEGQFDLIISNPPYIDSKAMGELPREVSGFDPVISLHGGIDGLEPYRIIAAQAAQHLKPGGAIVFEIGYDQDVSVPAILDKHSFKDILMLRDLSGLPRIVTARLQ